jgi:hypothetical protein
MALDPEVFITLTRARLAESARGSIARDDVAAQGTQADNNRPREPAISNFEPIKNLAVSQRWFLIGPRPPPRRPVHGPVTPAELSQWRGRAFDPLSGARSDAGG